MSRDAGKVANKTGYRNKPRRKTSVPRAVLVSAVMAAGTVLVYIEGLAGYKPAGGLQWALWPLVAAGCWASGAAPVKVRDRKMSVPVGLTAMPLLLGIVFLTPLAVLVAAAIGFLSADLQKHRPFPRVLTGLTAGLLASAAGIYAYDSVLSGASPVHGRGWLAGLAAVSVIAAADIGLVILAMAFADRRWRHPPVREMVRQLGNSVLVCAGGALVGISMVWLNLWSVLLVAFAGRAGYRNHNARVESEQDHASLLRLYEFTKSMAGLTEVRQVVLTVLDQARELLTAEDAEVVVPLDPRSEGRVLRAWVEEGEEPVIEQGVPLSLLDKIALRHGPLILSTRSDDPDVVAAVEERGLEEALVAPLVEGDPTGGYLLVATRPYQHDNFDLTDLGFLAALAANAGVGLRAGNLLDHLRAEISMREFEAHHDTLTGLANRTLFNRRLDEALLRNTGTKAAVMLIDLDGFKEVNDTLGHVVGDGILRLVAERLSRFSHGPDLVARFGGDEFAVMIGAAPDDLTIEATADQVLQVFMTPFELQGVMLDVRASIGVAIAPMTGRGRDPQALMRHADIAMYLAKGNGGAVRFYDPTEDRSTLRRLTLATELRQAMERGDLDLWYQPVVQLGTGEVLGCEALLRWNHQQFGPVPPGEFIPVAEGAGLIDPLTWWVLDQALEQVKSWRDVVPRLKVSVNISARSLTTAPVADRVARALDRADFPADALTLELTESCMTNDSRSSERAMRNLRDMGVSLAIDDYGTGFSSLSRLKHLPFQDLKIDRSFVKEMIRDRGDEAIVRSTIELARSLGRTVTAEGVEDQVTLHRLASLGCHAAQGYYLAKPLPASQCAMWLTAFVRWPSTVGSMQAGGGPGAGSSEPRGRDGLSWGLA